MAAANVTCMGNKPKIANGIMFLSDRYKRCYDEKCVDTTLNMVAIHAMVPCIHNMAYGDINWRQTLSDISMTEIVRIYGLLIFKKICDSIQNYDKKK